MLKKIKRLRANALIGLSLLGLILSIALIGTLLTPYDAVETDFLNRFALPSPMHLFGTDEYGRDVFSRVAAGAFISLRVALASVTIAIVAGVTVGGITGFFGGWLDRILMVFIDSLMAFPGLLLVLGIMAALGPTEVGVIFALGVAYTPSITRIVRGTVLSLREKEFVEASKLIGNSDMVTLFRHILPNCITPIIVVSTSIFTAAMLSETALSFLGLGVPPPAPSWGSMLSDSRNYLGLNPWMGIFPGIAITMTLLAVNLIGDALRDYFDPRMRSER
ncbi:MAG: ABC transporter permease [Kordiimonadaceae bacterium]|nr:ABC transporter permease [Kordiimonadaceae bacterium]